MYRCGWMLTKYKFYNYIAHIVIYVCILNLILFTVFAL